MFTRAWEEHVYCCSWMEHSVNFFISVIVFFSCEVPFDFLLCFIFFCLTPIFSFVLRVFVLFWNMVRTAFQSFSDHSAHGSFHDIPHPRPRRVDFSWTLFHLCHRQLQFWTALLPCLGCGLVGGGRKNFPQGSHQDYSSGLESLFCSFFFLFFLSKKQKFTINTSSNEMALRRGEVCGVLIESEFGKARISDGHFACLSSSLYTWGPSTIVRGFLFL